MKTKFFYLLYIFVTMFLNIELHSQTENLPYYLSQYNGIPIIAHTNLTSGTIIQAGTPVLQRMKELGVYGFIATNLDESGYNIIKNIGLKMIPYQIDTSLNNSIGYYTDAAYSIWEAEGDLSMGMAKIEYNSEIGEIFTDSVGINGVRTKIDIQGENELIFGPWYYQGKKYKLFEDWQLIGYTADYRLKIEPIIPESMMPFGYTDSVVCELQITASNFDENLIERVKVLWSKNLKVSDFQTGNQLWNTWKNYSHEYNLSSLSEMSPEERKIPTETFDPATFTSDYMQYKVIWKGRTFLKLYVDKIHIYDDRGNRLYNDYPTRNQIKTAIRRFTDKNEVIGLHGLNEPGSIDNYLCFREMGNLIKGEEPDLDIYTSICTSWFGRYGQNHYLTKGVNNLSIYPGYEFYKKTGMKYVSMNIYSFNYPILPPVSEFPACPGYELRSNVYDTLNVYYLTYRSLNFIHDYNIPLSYSTQTGKFYNWKNGVDEYCFSKVPENKELNYHVNIGLLYGAKELTIDPTFTLAHETNGLWREGLIDFTNSGGNYPFTPLGEFFKDIIKPRLSGLMGKTLKKLNQAHQILGVDVLTNNLNNINYRKLKYINCPATEATICTTDVGFFDSNEPWKNHFFIINRHYSSESSLTIGLKDLYVYSNWTLSNLTDTVSTTINKDSGNEATFNEEIPPGDGKLYSLSPTVISGGELTGDETIGTTTTLSGNLIVGTGVTLTVNSVYNLYGDITIKSGGAIKTTGEGVINVYQGKRIIAEGISEISGTSTGKITINFIAPVQNNGIYALQEAFLTVNYAKIMNAVYGIIYQNPSAQRLNGSLTITNCELINCNTGIKLENLTTFTPLITGNIIMDCNIGIMGINNSGTTIMNNSITSWSGIWLTNTSGGSIINNQLEPQTVNNGVGIYLQSSLGTIRENYIDNFSNGIFLANSSPLLGENIITNNSQYGIYCGSGSSPQLSMSLLASEGNEQYYLIAGLNYLENNGTETNNTPELYISNSLPNLDFGYNCIIDDRDLKSLLIGGEFEEAHPPVPARMNYWGDYGNEPYERFGINVDYGDYLTMCAQQGVIFGVNYIEMRDNNNVVTDTLYSLQQEPVNISTREILESEAENAFITGDYSEAKNKYLALVNAYGTEAGGIKSYHRLYETDKMVGITDEIISSRISLCQEKANQTTDTLLRKMVNQIISLYYIERREFQTALSRYEGIIGTSIIEEEALFAELDAYTVAYLSSQSQGGLGKVKEGKYFVKPNEDYAENIMDVLSKKFSVFKSETKKEVIPEQYNLFQNYPNPFNPETVISYQLVAGGQVSLKVYDILGNEIVTLVDKEQESGRYQVTFDASKLASGVYICRIVTGDFVKTIKMSLVK